MEHLLAERRQVVQQPFTVVNGVMALLDEHATVGIDRYTEDLRPADVDPEGWSFPVGGRQAPASTRAFRSLMAACKMFPSARRLMNPGSGTRSSTTS